MHSQTDLQLPSRLARFMHQAAAVLVFGFVCWHLFFLAVRNFARDENQAISKFCDKIRMKPALDLANKWTGAYESVLGRAIVNCCVLSNSLSGGFLHDSVFEGTSYDDECDLFVAA